MGVRLPVLILTMAALLGLPEHLARADSHIYFPASVGYRWTYRTALDDETTWEFLSRVDMDGVEYMLYGPSVDVAQRLRLSGWQLRCSRGTCRPQLRLPRAPSRAW